MSSVDIGLALGTANPIITVGGKGIVMNEPSVVAYDKKKKCVLAVGSEAYRMLGRTPEYIVAVKPLKDGVISDNEITEEIKNLINENPKKHTKLIKSGKVKNEVVSKYNQLIKFGYRFV